jgi:hypothetical protein
MYASAFITEAVLPWAGMDENAGDDSTPQPEWYGRVVRSDITRASAAISLCLTHGTRAPAHIAALGDGSGECRVGDDGTTAWCRAERWS